MNLRAVLWLLGRVTLLLASFELVPLAVALIHGERDVAVAFVVAAGVTAGIGLLACFRNAKATVNAEGRPDFYRREGLAAVGGSWIVVPVLGALPYLLTGAIASPVDALFESISGFTTTGSTILTGEGIDGLSRGVAFWRSFTHWLGGIGIVLVFVVFFPVGGRSLFRSEVPGITREASHARVRDAALGLVRVYLALTLVEAGLLMLAGLDLFDALVHTFGTVATGGFSSHSASVAHFASWTVEVILLVFMVLAGINFAFYDTISRGSWRIAWRALRRSSELRAYVGILVLATLAITLRLWFWGGSNGIAPVAGEPLPDYSHLSLCVRDASFAVCSIQTSTGYATADFDQWPNFCRVALMMLAFVGACAGSTGGGLKVVRLLVVLKVALVGVRRFARPRAVHGVRMNRDAMEEGLVSSVTAYFCLWVAVFLGGTLALSGLGVDVVDASTAVLATLNNIGPGLDSVGPVQNFEAMPGLAKALLSVLMLLGRLEFYALVVLVLPRFWTS